MITKQIIEKSLRFLITSTIHTAGNTELTEEDQDDVINLQFNMLTNMLQPEYALIFVDELLKFSGEIETLDKIKMKETVEEILIKMREI